MLTIADDMNAEIAKLDADIAILDRDIEGRERRLSMIRQHREELWRRRATLQGQLERENATFGKPVGKCVTEVGSDGVHWNV